VRRPAPLPPRAAVLLLVLGFAPAAGAAFAGAAEGPAALAAGDLPRAAAGAAFLLLALLLPERSLPFPGGPAGHGGAVLGAGLVGLLLVLRFSLPAPVSNDEEAMLLQARHYASGRLAEPLPPASCGPGERLCALHRRQVHEDAGAGLRYSKYPPGTALAWMPGVLLGLRHLGPLLLLALDLFLLGAAARRLGLDSALAHLLLLASPFFLLVQTSWQSELVTLPAALGTWLLLLRLRAGEGGAGTALGVGALAGCAFLARPLTGVVLALACAPGLLSARRSWRLRLAPVLGGLPFLAALLLWQQALSGDPWLSPYEAYARRFGPFAPDGSPVDVYGRGAFLPGLLRQAARLAVALGPGGLFLLALPALASWRSRDGGAALLLTIGLPLAYAFHWYPGHPLYPGPLYAFEALPFLVLGLAAATAAWSRPRRRAFLTAVLAGGLLLVQGRWPALREEARLRHEPWRLAQEAPRDAVILLGFPEGPPAEVERILKRAVPSAPPLPRQAPVLIRELPAPGRTARDLELLGLAGRPLFRYEAGAPGRLVPLKAPPP